MTYSEAMAFIESIPKFSPAAIVEGDEPMFGLDSIRYLLHLLGDPQKKLHYVHVGGTNGKGSTVAFMASILKTAGYKTGIYTSPALERFTERIRVNGEDIPEDDLGRLTGVVYQAYRQMLEEGKTAPTEFEIVCSVAFLYFLEQGCDIVLLEVGLGGRLDATNIIDHPEIAMITTISRDHTELLGDTLELIAGEKAGIIKAGCDVVLYPQPESVRAVFAEVCAEKHAVLHDAVIPAGTKQFSLEGQVFDLTIGDAAFTDLHIGLLGNYQINNAAMAVNGAICMRRRGWEISDEEIREGLAQASWPGRFELMKKEPAIIVDGGHNEEGARALRESLLRYFPEGGICFVTGVLADKAYDRMMGQTMDLAARYFTVTPPNPRALPAEDLAEWFRERGAEAEACCSIEEALDQAVAAAGPEGVVCVFGSLYYLGAVRKHLA
ncbi:MAG: folylpolyglutamate synthase/dihydrofolate synthase family protein [Eubacteriales bacterium]|nr:folylpolyglutamate synthase/dihydrofolate synthase family protein [Eubacteriales bacterium]